MSKVISFEGIDCANCAAKLENKLNKIKGVNAEISFVSGKMFLELDDASLLNEVESVCHKVEPGMVLHLWLRILKDKKLF